MSLQRQIIYIPQKMRTNRYYIKIKFSKRNSFTRRIDNVPYKNSGIFGDSFIFKSKEINIVASRSAIYKKDEILNNTSNSIYQQIAKALLYCYAINLSNLQLLSIDIVRKTERKEESVIFLPYDKNTQPISNDIITPASFKEEDLSPLLQEDDKAEHLRNILSHWLKGMSSTERYYKFERLWRSFEQLSFYCNRVDANNKEFNALRKIRSFLITNPKYFTNTERLLSTMTYDDLRKFYWRKLILNNYPKAGKRGVYEGYKDYFVLANTDYRIINLLDEFLTIRQNELTNYGFIRDIKNHITYYKQEQHLQTNNMQLAALLCCKYAYFLRNKIFHGELIDKTFSFIPNNNDDVLIDKLNTLLGIITLELIKSYTNL